MKYLVCYTFQSSNKGDASADTVITAPALSSDAIASIRKSLATDLKNKGFTRPSIVFTSITTLDEP